ncbi:Serine/threonine-protein kinase HipA [Raoultella planticola]|uniref:Serine/threonine-protein kinase HipA n=1 Tax=Raoultella planticola TaxID=575 RepID=A0A485CVU3_RAOPL|nr:Serine/threonine-protein kinase HipA [Raoultella planticola]
MSESANLSSRRNGAHLFRYEEAWMRNPRARPLSLSLPLQYGNITDDAVFNYFDNLLPDSPRVRDRIVKRYQARSKQPFDLLAEIGRDSVGAGPRYSRQGKTQPGRALSWEGAGIATPWMRC